MSIILDHVHVQTDNGRLSMFKVQRIDQINFLKETPCPCKMQNIFFLRFVVSFSIIDGTSWMLLSRGYKITSKIVSNI